MELEGLSWGGVLGRGGNPYPPARGLENDVSPQWGPVQWGNGPPRVLVHYGFFR